MNLKALDTWITALRTTGAYQLFGKATDYSGGYCALGVIWAKFGSVHLAHLQALEITPRDLEVMGITADTEGFVKAETTVPEYVFSRQIVYMNDVEHRSFAEIANWLEEQALKLFPVPENVPFQEVIREEELVCR